MLKRPWPLDRSPFWPATFIWAWVWVWGLLLGSCQAPAPQPPSERIIPSSGGVSDALNDYLLAQDAPRDTAYQIAYVDLNSDRTPEALVLLEGQFWCGLRGCPLLVFRGVNENRFIYLSRIEPLRAPVFVSDRRTNGWRDLVVSTTVAGRPEDVRLTFGMAGYPSQADSGEVVNGAEEPAGERVF